MEDHAAIRIRKKAFPYCAERNAEAKELKRTPTGVGRERLSVAEGEAEECDHQGKRPNSSP
jgi:hypothetical protein